jgi:hypothetical protein
MSLPAVGAAAATAMLTSTLTVAAPALASPESPCAATPIPICAFLPVLPSLDHDVDLTTTGPEPNTQTPDEAQSPGAAIDGR